MMSCKTNQSMLVRFFSLKVFTNSELWLGAKSCWIALSKRKVFFYVIVLIYHTSNENLSSSALGPWKPQNICFKQFLYFVGNVQIQLENPMNVLDLPDNSPYLNPIENLWYT